MPFMLNLYGEFNYSIKYGGFEMAFEREIIRDERFEIRMSKEEKELFYAYAKELGIMPGRLARNILLDQASAKIENAVMIPFIKGYKKYLEITGQKETLERIENTD